MKDLFNYCVYRIAFTYKKMKMRDYIAQGYYLMFFAFTFYALALTQWILYLFGLGLNRTLILVICIPLIIEIFFLRRLFPNNEKVYQECESKYRLERCRWFKGLLVFLFLLLSIISYIVALITTK